MTEFERELRNLINRYSIENASNTPDFILAAFLAESLTAFNKAVYERGRWYGYFDGTKVGGNSTSQVLGDKEGK